jgi:hypothetical protein
MRFCIGSSPSGGSSSTSSSDDGGGGGGDGDRPVATSYCVIIWPPSITCACLLLCSVPPPDCLLFDIAAHGGQRQCSDHCVSHCSAAQAGPSGPDPCVPRRFLCYEAPPPALAAQTAPCNASTRRASASASASSTDILTKAEREIDLVNSRSRLTLLRAAAA